MPIIKELVESLDEIKELHESKNDDYAIDDNPFFNFDVQEYFINLFTNPRDKVFASIVGLKIARLAVQLNKEYEDKHHKPKNETVLDTFNDDATYTLLWKSDYQRRIKKGKIK